MTGLLEKVRSLLTLKRPVKRVLMMIADGLLLSLAVWLSFSIRLGVFYLPPSWAFFALLIAAPVLGVALFERFGLYRMVTRYIGSAGNWRIFYAISLTVLCWAMLTLQAQLPGIFPRSSFVLFWLLANMLIIGSRQVMSATLNALLSDEGDRPSLPAGDKIKVLIYGAGSAGNMLAMELEHSRTYRPIGFVDDDSSLWGQKVGSYKVRRPSKIGEMVAHRDIDEILLALPSATTKQRRDVLAALQQFPVRVKTVPSIGDIASGRFTVSDIRPVSPDDLLGRDPVAPNKALLAQDISGKPVMITGAGGSIGSELARQVLALGPRTLILFELSEVALYDIEMEIREAEAAFAQDDGQGSGAAKRCQIVAVLGSVLDAGLLRRTIKAHGVATIYHAAAYKHVPIVELNPVAGLRNNSFGTMTLVDVARELKVARFVLISTDKAVRPTNIMGASKRLAELILQANAALPGTGTVFTMVRFGNVLASSGSVVRRFVKQIEAGGPVTVTHKDIIRYFMSIPEAAQLVIQAGAMAGGGEVFVLDMGEQVKIDELARTMIRLSGLQVYDEAAGTGDIAISYTGLRPGEKLFEELLLGENTASTGHPRIMRNSEPSIAQDELKKRLGELHDAMEAYDLRAIHDLLMELVEGYKPQKGATQALEATRDLKAS